MLVCGCRRSKEARLSEPLRASEGGSLSIAQGDAVHPDESG